MVTAALLLCAALANADGDVPRCEVVVFLGTDCPLAKLYAGRLRELADRYPQVQFQGVCAREDEAEEKVREFGRGLSFGFRQDEEAVKRLGATRSPEAFLLVNGSVVYRGRIDDQYTPGTNKSQPTRRDLEEAIQEVLAGEAVSVPVTEATGCVIARSNQAPGARDGNEPVTFADVAAIFHRRCAECHRPGEVGPFSLLTYADVAGHTATIREVIDNGRMPPWHADPNFGRFVNDRSLTADEKALLARWFAAGAPAGEREVEVPAFSSGWSIRPDVVLQMEQLFQVSAEGIIEYQEFVLDPGFQRDTWIEAVEVRPGNRAVVHHVNVLLRPKGALPETVFANAMQDWCFAILVPGNAVTVWPEGMAKVIPAGWDIVLSVHYQTIGTPQEDRTAIGLQLADGSGVRKMVATRTMLLPELKLPPNEVKTLTNVWKLEDDYTLHSLVPHMHLRGRSMRVEADGEVLLNVPHYDFNWQHRYIFAEPKSFPKGTVITVTAVFDNTAENPNNPDPNATVHEGRLTTDEMFQLSCDISRTYEDRLAQGWRVTAVAIALLLGAGLLFCLRGRSAPRG